MVDPAGAGALRLPAGQRPSNGADIGVVIPAAGAGVRFGRRKAFLELAGRPLLFHCLRTFVRMPAVGEVAVALPAEDLAAAREVVPVWVAEALSGAPSPRLSLVAGGRRRQDSVEAGLAALSPSAKVILVHDAARPLVLPSDIDAVAAAVREAGAAVIGWPSTDSVKEEHDGRILRDLPRERVWAVQTPRGALAPLLRGAFDEARRRGLEVTDETGLLSAVGVPVRLVRGSRTNIKITFPEDLPLAAFILEKILGQRS